HERPCPQSTNRAGSTLRDDHVRRLAGPDEAVLLSRDALDLGVALQALRVGAELGRLDAQRREAPARQVGIVALLEIGARRIDEGDETCDDTDQQHDAAQRGAPPRDSRRRWAAGTRAGTVGPADRARTYRGLRRWTLPCNRPLGSRSASGRRPRWSG